MVSSKKHRHRRTRIGGREIESTAAPPSGGDQFPAARGHPRDRYRVWLRIRVGAAIATMRDASSPWRFLVRAVALMVVLYGAYYYPHGPHGIVARSIEGYLAVQAWAAGVLIRLFDSSTAVSGTIISSRFPISIVKACSSLDAQALFVAGVLAFPARATAKFAGVGLGIAVLTALNLGRILVLWLIGVHAPTSFDTAHEEVLPLVLVVAACGCFTVWAMWVKRGGPTQTAVS